jgi:RNAse (barnase) inhibitor barstar
LNTLVLGEYLSHPMRTVHVDATKIKDWTSFFDEFSSAFGFPEFFGWNMDAWIDCMTNLDEEFSSVCVQPGELVCVALDGAAEFKACCPDQFQAFVECASFVNWRRLEIGEPAILVVSFNV